MFLHVYFEMMRGYSILGREPPPLPATPFFFLYELKLNICFRKNPKLADGRCDVPSFFMHVDFVGNLDLCVHATQGRNTTFLD